MSNFTAAQCRAARALLDWNQSELSERANVALSTVRRFEKSANQPIANNLVAIRTALESAGVIFIDQNGNGPGVRLRDRDEARDGRPL
jgi:transcriptional regulator with XRE-family HTH domain